MNPNRDLRNAALVGSALLRQGFPPPESVGQLNSGRVRLYFTRQSGMGDVIVDAFGGKIYVTYDNRERVFGKPALAAKDIRDALRAQDQQYLLHDV